MTVKVYSTQSCIWCKRVKEYLTEKGVEFEPIDVGADREAAKQMVAKTGQMGVPVIDVDGRFIVGFDKAALDEALGL
ncbi:MAG: glutaredoxin domain-containing protein [Synergistota bacterium]|nr:glutaredoxin domain-containing protein [Synergistota bacterium]